ncbi:MAG: ribosome-associated protein [Syntrophaceae bacterium]|nr:MAG: ribosome-associated protein [Syntrophaceae bacterium]
MPSFRTIKTSKTLKIDLQPSTSRPLQGGQSKNLFKELILPVKKNESARRLLLCINAVLQKKAKNIVVLNVKETSSFTDYLLICSGATDRQVQAVSDAIQEYLKKEDIRPLGVEGKTNAEWILLDYDDVVISVFQESARSFYGLEDLWDAPRMKIDENAAEIKKLTKDMA